MGWTVRGTGKLGGTCRFCQKKNLKKTILIQEEGSVDLVPAGRDCAAKLVYGESNHRILKRIDAEARQADLAVAQRKQRKRERIDPNLDKTNLRYIQSGRPNLGSYLAGKGGLFVRVDGSDPDDVAFYELLGFEQISAKITAQH